MKGSAFLPILFASVTPLILLGLIIFGSTLGLVAWTPSVLWTDQSGNSNAISNANGVTATDAGVYVTGYLDGNRSSNGSPFIAQYTTAGRSVWMKMVDNPNVLTLNGISLGSDGIYLCGRGFENDSVLKYDFNGNGLWTQTIQGAHFDAISVIGDNVYVAGDSGHPLTNQTITGTIIFFVREYDSSGKMVWTSEFGNATNILSEIKGIYATSSGAYILTTDVLVGYTLSGTLLWTRHFGPQGFVTPFAVSGDSTGVYVSGTASLSTLGVASGFLSKFDFDGNMVWNENFDSPDGAGVGVDSVAAGSGIYLAMVSPLGNGFVKKYGTGGSEVWSFQTPLKPATVLIDPPYFRPFAGAGEFYLAGAFKSGGGIGSVALVQGFTGDASLIFFGVNPPLSFVFFGGSIAIIALCIIVLMRRHLKTMSKRPKSASLDRLQKPGVPDLP